MKKNILPVISAAFIFTILLAGCGGFQTPTAVVVTATVEPATPTLTSTPDPCAQQNIHDAVDKVHQHMREFDDAAILASSIPRDQLNSSIADLQRIRREAEDEIIPSCLSDLKRFQIQHMNSVIDTLIAFLRGSEQQTLDQGIALARQQHDQYILELARLLGITPVPATVVIVVPSQTPTP